MNMWQTQIAMLPVRRVYPDDAKNVAAAEKRQQNRGRKAGREAAINIAKRNQARVLRLFKRDAELTAPQVSDELDMPVETARNALNKLTFYGLLESQRDGNTIVFRKASQ